MHIYEYVCISTIYDSYSIDCLIQTKSQSTITD